MPYFKGSYIEASFFKTTLNFRHCHCCKVSPSIGCPMDRRYFNQEATSAIFSKNFLTNFFFGLLFGLSRCLPSVGHLFQDHFQLQALPLLQSFVLRRSPMEQCYFNQAATSTIFSKNFSTNFFFGLLLGRFRWLVSRGTIFRKP